MNVMTIVILAVLALFAWNGYRKGLVRSLSGVAALIISSVLVSSFLPVVTQILQERTPVCGWVEEQCRITVSSMAAKAVTQQTVEDAGIAQGNQYGRDEIRNLMDQYGLDGSRIDNMSDEMVEEFVNTDLRDYLEQIGVGGLLGTGTATVSDSLKALSSLTQNEQTRLIQNLPVPDFLKKLIFSYNNSQGYQKLNAQDFGEYLTKFVAGVVMNIISFIVTLIVVELIVWGILLALDLFAHLPLIGIANRMGGLALGIVKGVFVVWLIFLVISMLSGTPVGIFLMDMIDDSLILRPLYQTNIFLKIVAGAMQRIIR